MPTSPKKPPSAFWPTPSTVRESKFIKWFQLSKVRVSSRLVAKATLAIHSLWKNYVQTKKTGDLKKHLEAMGILWLYRHSSGHIHHDDILAFVRRVQPKVLIPIHTETGDRFAEFLPEIRVKRLVDGEAFVL